MKVSPSFLSCDFTKLKAEIESISIAEWIHFDVMDGKFVPNITYDYNKLKEIKKYSKQFFDCHLMINYPEKYVQDYIDAGADLITFHFEATKEYIPLIRYIQSKGIKAGISIKPNTKVTELDNILNIIDLILIMSVEPGRGGQKFIPSSIDKISYLNKKRHEFNYRYLIEVDGGINFETAKLVKEAGCDVIVVGSFIFKNDNREQLIKELENV